MTATTLNTQATSVRRIKYFRVPIYCANMIPNVTYTAAINGINIGPYCKPKGGVLGGPLTSDSTGKLQFTYLLSIPYNTTFLTNPSNTTGILNQSKVITMTDPFGRISITYLPITMKSN